MPINAHPQTVNGVPRMSGHFFTTSTPQTSEIQLYLAATSTRPPPYPIHALSQTVFMYCATDSL